MSYSPHVRVFLLAMQEKVQTRMARTEWLSALDRAQNLSFTVAPMEGFFYTSVDDGVFTYKKLRKACKACAKEQIKVVVILLDELRIDLVGMDRIDFWTSPQGYNDAHVVGKIVRAMQVQDLDAICIVNCLDVAKTVADQLAVHPSLPRKVTVLSSSTRDSSIFIRQATAAAMTYLQNGTIIGGNHQITTPLGRAPQSTEVDIAETAVSTHDRVDSTYQQGSGNVLIVQTFTQVENRSHTDDSIDGSGIVAVEPPNEGSSTWIESGNSTVAKETRSIINKRRASI